MELFLKLNSEHKVTFVIATHDAGIMAYARRLVRLRDGRIVGDEAQVAEAVAS